MDDNYSTKWDSANVDDTGSTNSSGTTESTSPVPQKNPDIGKDLQPEVAEKSSDKPDVNCCIRNLDVCCGGNVRGIRDCCCCLGKASKDVYHGCRHLDCKGGVKRTFTVDSARKKFPVSLWLPKYRLNYLLGDVMAGLTVGLTALPQGLAYAKIALLPPQYGLYSLFMPCYMYLIFGTAKDISIGPTAVMSLLTSEFAESPIEGDPTYAIVLAMMCGIIQLVMGILHLGFLVDYISHPVINAFTMASVVTICFSQIPNWLGLQDIPRDFVQQVYEIFKNLPETQIYDFLLGLGCMIILFLMKNMKSFTCMKSKSDSKCVAAARYFVWLLSTGRNAVVMMIGIGLAAILLLYGHEPFSLTGDIPSGLPPFKPPSFSGTDGNTTYNAEDIFKKIGSGLVVVPLLGLVETIAIGKSFARVNKYKINPDQELLALGAGNLLGSFVSGYPVTGSFSRTSVNCQSGARTTGAGFWTATLVLLVIAFLTPVFYYIPDATLAAIIIMALLDMADFTLLIELWHVKKIDIIPWVVTFVFSLLIGVDNGVIIGVIVSLCILLYPSARPKITAVSDDSDTEKIEDFKKTEVDELPETEKDFAVIELNQGLTFPSSEHFIRKVQKVMASGESTGFRSVIIDFSHVTATDSTITRSIEQLAEDFKLAGVSLVLCNVQSQVMKVLVKANIKHLIYATTRTEAIETVREISADEEDKRVQVFVLSIPTDSSINDHRFKLAVDEDQLNASFESKNDQVESSSSSASSTKVTRPEESHESIDVGCESEYYEF